MTAIESPTLDPNIFKTSHPYLSDKTGTLQTSLPIAMDGAVLDQDCTLSGRLCGQDLVVQGSFDGELVLSGRLRAAGASRLHARVRAAVVELEGEFEGEVQAGTLLLAESARAHGVFVAERLAVREGAILDGSVTVPASTAMPVPRPEPADGRQGLEASEEGPPLPSD